jgi:hypothetical protein
MRRLLAERSHPNFIGVIRDALAEGGLAEDEVDYLALLHMKRSFHHRILSDHGLRAEQHALVWIEDSTDGYLQRLTPSGDLHPSFGTDGRYAVAFEVSIHMTETPYFILFNLSP